jgi:hypothetical protein
LLAPAAALADDPFYLGAWTVVSAEPGPWVRSFGEDDLAAAHKLVGTRVVFGKQSVEAPEFIACTHARYFTGGATAHSMFDSRLTNVPLPEGAPTEDADTYGHNLRPGKAAERLGFKGFSWKTLSTACTSSDHPVPTIYFANPRVAVFQLDDVVVTMTHG